MTQKTDETKAAEDFGLSDVLPDGWRPTEGSTVVGRIIGITKGWSDPKESFYPIVVIHDEITDQDIAVHCFHFVLMDRLSALRPQVGERIGIKMGPKVALKSNSSKSVQTYTVKVEGRSEDIWNDIPSPRGSNAAAPADNQGVTTTSDDSELPF